jgi:DHA1 family multidrug resistance protein-like MFS transporter
MTLLGRLAVVGWITVWFGRWRAVAPLFLAEAIVWVGFGAMLPVLPLYFTEQGVDLATLGLVTAAWPAARLVWEPIFGWLADRTARVPIMVGGLIAAAAFLVLPLAVHGPLAFLILRALAGLATAAYDPAARGVLMDGTPPERQGEAFGWYGAAQMAGLLFGPAIGAIGSAMVGSIAFVFWFGGASALFAAVAVAALIRDRPRGRRVPVVPASGLADFARTGPPDPPRPTVAPPSTLANRILVAAIIANLGGNFGAGTYDVIWSLFLTAKGASLELVGFTFMLFSLPMLLFSPRAGRLVDQRGSLGFVIGGSLAIATASTLYTFVPDAAWTIPILAMEATGFAVLIPALYAVVSRGSPPDRSSTAQGLFGAAGTVGFVIASLVTGWLATINLNFPFYLFTIVVLVTLGLALLIGRREIAATDTMSVGGIEPSQVQPI